MPKRTSWVRMLVRRPGGTGEPDGHRLVAADEVRRPVRGLGFVEEVQIRESLNQHVKRRAQFQPGQRVAQAEVRSVAEREVLVGGPPDIEAERIGELRFISIEAGSAAPSARIRSSDHFNSSG